MQCALYHAMTKEAASTNANGDDAVRDENENETGESKKKVNRPCKFFNRNKAINKCTNTAESCGFLHECSHCGSSNHGRGKFCREPKRDTTTTTTSPAAVDVDSGAETSGDDVQATSVPEATSNAGAGTGMEVKQTTTTTDSVDGTNASEYQPSFEGDDDLPQSFKTKCCRYFNYPSGCDYADEDDCDFVHACSHCGEKDHPSLGKCTNPRLTRLICPDCDIRGIMGEYALAQHRDAMHG